MSDASIKLLIATQELVRQAELSLDYRPELRRAIAAAHQATFAVAAEKRDKALAGPRLPGPTHFVQKNNEVQS